MERCADRLWRANPEFCPHATLGVCHQLAPHFGIEKQEVGQWRSVRNAAALFSEHTQQAFIAGRGQLFKDSVVKDLTVAIDDFEVAAMIFQQQADDFAVGNARLGQGPQIEHRQRWKTLAQQASFPTTRPVNQQNDLGMALQQCQTGQQKVQSEWHHDDVEALQSTLRQPALEGNEARLIKITPPSIGCARTRQARINVATGHGP